MRFRPVSLDVLATELADRVADRPADRWTRLAVDGAPAARPGEFADALADRVRLRGRAVLRASGADFLRPASLRLERGRHDPAARRYDWPDTGGLVRELLGPLEPDGSGRVLPALWDAAADRATRADYVTLPRGGVLIFDGELLLGRDLPWDYSVHLWLSAAALARRTPADQRWALPAFADYDAEVRPLLTADTGVLVDKPDRPAVLDAAGA